MCRSLLRHYPFVWCICVLCWLDGHQLPAAESAAELALAGPRHIVFMIGEPEYGTDVTVPQFFKTELAEHGYRATFVMAARSGETQHDFTGLEKILPEADLLVLSVRRRAPQEAELQAVRTHLASGKPLVAIRTASHAFDARTESPPGHAQWLKFDEEVLGAKYFGHYGDEPFEVRVAAGATADPLLHGIDSWQSSKLYKIQLQSPAAKLLLVGRRPDGQEEPVAWTFRYGSRAARVFYTSLGLESDFQQSSFRRLLDGAIRWALEHD